MKEKNAEENRSFDNSSSSILRTNWKMAIALKNKKRVVSCCIVLKKYFYLNINNEIKACMQVYTTLHTRLSNLSRRLETNDTCTHCTTHTCLCIFISYC